MTKTSITAVSSSSKSRVVGTTSTATSSRSRIAERIRRSSFWIEWLRRPSLDVAESVMRLRRLRGFSQADLAKRIGTHQPAIARIESGQANIGLSTLTSLATALDAVVRIDMRPVEELGVGNWQAHWWQQHVLGDPQPINSFVAVHNTVNMLFVVGAAPDISRFAPAGAMQSRPLHSLLQLRPPDADAEKGAE